MNKTVNINLAGIFFHIDEDAYIKLQRYLEAIKRSFTDSQGRSEIIADIEARIAELFSERIQNEKQVVGIKLVDDVITIMGQPEDYLVDDEIFEDEPKAKTSYSSKATKKLYRDTDNSYIGGVAAGLSHYFGIDTIWMRLIWALLTIGSGGTFIFIYLIFWALVPEASTTAEKLTMSGDPVNISNIEKKIKDSIDSVSEAVKNIDFKKHEEKFKEGFDHVSGNISETVKNVDFQKQGNRLKSSSQTFFDSIGTIIMFFLKIIAKFIGVILIITGITALLVFIVALFSVGITNAVNVPGMDLVELGNAANTPMWLISMLVFFAVAIPFFFILYLGLKILIKNLKSIGHVAKFTLLGLWLISLIGIAIIGFRQAAEHAFEASVSQKETLNIKSGDTLKISMHNFEDYNGYVYRNGSDLKIIENDNGRSIMSSDVRIKVKSTTDSLARLIIEKEAEGNNYNNAKKRAERINYKYTFNKGLLKLDKYLITDAKNKFSDQEVNVILYLPEGTIIYADKNTRGYSSYSNNLLYNVDKNHYVKILNDDTACLDCELDKPNNLENNKGDKSDTTKNTTEEPDVSVKINEVDGIDINVNNN
ncbi:PspC domain-containing protein [uncultured Winogradskyella sp.]|uniref:PspC domain-containing protein n=1 Tax=uncultured Winogradskyella sp. TaxID=395353 RepID=UPI00261665A5|nr:PspC domain-containing protein [uncultured Winogradskyella sp.]